MHIDVTRRQALGILTAPLVLPWVTACRDAFAPDLTPSFSTSSGPITLIGAGDPQSSAYRGRTGKIIQAALDADPNAFAFCAGDLVANGTRQEFRDHYDPTWGVFRDRTFAIMGNHDRKADPTGTAYYEYWAELAGPRGKGYYAKTLGNWRLYFLNSEQVREEQFAWLADDLPQWSTYHIGAFFHTPMFASPCDMNGPQTMTWPGNLGVGGFWRVLEQHGCEFAVSGHAHRYERFPRMIRNTKNSRLGTLSPDGIRQFVIGTGGIRPMPPWREKHPYIESQVTARGVARLGLYSDRYEWAFTDLNGVQRDSGVEMCRKVLVA